MTYKADCQTWARISEDNVIHAVLYFQAELLNLRIRLPKADAQGHDREFLASAPGRQETDWLRLFSRTPQSCDRFQRVCCRTTRRCTNCPTRSPRNCDRTRSIPIRRLAEWQITPAGGAGWGRACLSAPFSAPGFPGL